MPDEELSTPPEGGEEVDGTPSADGAEPESPEAPKEAEETEKTVSFEDHQKLQARLAYAERELRRKEREKPVEEKKPEQPVEVSQKPVEADFEDYNEFVEALTDWKTDRKMEGFEKTSREKTQQEKIIEQNRRVDTIVAAETVKDPDFLKKAYIPIGLEDLVVDSDQFVDLALYFGQNPNEAMRLLDLPVVQAAREIGRIESKLQIKTPQPRTISKAPTPTKTVGGNEVVEKTIDDMTAAEHIAYMNKKDFG